MTVLTAHSGTLDVTGGRVWYEVGGPSAAVAGAPAVLLLHAGTTDARLWDEEFAALAGRHRVVRLDARGHGRSSTISAPFSPVEDVAAVLAHLGIDRVVGVGCSLGGATAVALGIERPELVAGVVVAGGGLFGRTWTDPAILAWEASMLAEAPRAMATGDAEPLVATVVDGILVGPRRTRADVDPGLYERVAGLVRNTVLTHYANCAQPEAAGQDRLRELVAPALVLVGEHDFAELHGAARDLAEQAAAARFEVVPGAGHLLANERPEWFHEQLEEFLATMAP